ncbi:alpha-glucosidase C-terminal domain-containing protein, partial [Acinetobacter baumannii]
GSIRFLESAEPVLLFERMLADETLLLAFNLSAEAVSHPLPPGNWQQVVVPGPDAGTVQGNELQLPPRAVYCARRS